METDEYYIYPMVDGIYKALLSGAAARDVQSQIESLSEGQHELLLCMLSGIRNELATNCIERAQEVDHVLRVNSFRPPPMENTASCCLCSQCALQHTCPQIRAGRVQVVPIRHGQPQ